MWTENSKSSGQWSSCWKRAVENLIQGCRDLKDNDERRSKLAVHLTNCHLMKSGIRPFICTEDMSVRECTHDMYASQSAWTTYTQFITHVGMLLHFGISVYVMQITFVIIFKQKCFQRRLRKQLMIY